MLLSQVGVEAGSSCQFLTFSNHTQVENAMLFNFIWHAFWIEKTGKCGGAGDSSADPAAKSFPGPFFKVRSVADSPRFFPGVWL